MHYAALLLPANTLQRQSSVHRPGMAEPPQHTWAAATWEAQCKLTCICQPSTTPVLPQICKEHFKAACVSVGGMGMRFCQKCGHFQVGGVGGQAGRYPVPLPPPLPPPTPLLLALRRGAGVACMIYATCHRSQVTSPATHPPIATDLTFVPPPHSPDNKHSPPQPVSEFEAEKRTCRVALEFHNARRRKRQRVLASGGKRGSPTDTSSDRSAPGRCSPHVRQQLQQPQPEQQRWQPPPQQQELTLLPPVQQPQQQQQAQQQVLVLDGMPLLAPLPDMSDAHVRPRLAPAQATPTAAFGPALRMLVHAQRLSPANDWDQPGRGGMAHTSTVPLPLPGTWGHPQQLPAAMFGSLLEMALVEVRCCCLKLACLRCRLWGGCWGSWCECLCILSACPARAASAALAVLVPSS